MGKSTGIQWCDATFNPWIGCAKVSAGCANCYAERYGERFGVEWGPGGERRRTSPDYWRQPLRWNAQAKRDGVRRRVFCASLADVFEARPELEAWRAELWWLTESTPHLDWLLLTKRPENAGPLWAGAHVEGWNGADSLGTTWRPNVWLGTSAENQETADERVPHLLSTRAAVHFVSCEPLLGPVDLRVYLRTLRLETQLSEMVTPGIDWVIVGGESGPGARPMHPDWARSLRDQCQAAGVPFLFKQWGEWAPSNAFALKTELAAEPGDLWRNVDGSIARLREPYGRGRRLAGELVADKTLPQVGEWDQAVYRVGKYAAGRLLDGREWNEFPGNATPTNEELDALGIGEK